MKDFLCLLATAMSGAAFFMSIWAAARVNKPAEYLKGVKGLLAEIILTIHSLNQLPRVEVQIADKPEPDENARRQARFEEGLQNIYNYGGNVPKLNVEELCDE